MIKTGVVVKVDRHILTLRSNEGLLDVPSGDVRPGKDVYHEMGRILFESIKFDISDWYQPLPIVGVYHSTKDAQTYMVFILDLALRPLIEKSHLWLSIMHPITDNNVIKYSPVLRDLLTRNWYGYGFTRALPAH